ADVLAALKTLSADPSLEVRIEATRALPGLGKDAIALLEKASRDGNPEVERAAIEALGQVARANPYGVSSVLEKVMQGGKVGLKRAALEAFGQVGESKASAATTALGKAMKDPDPQLRQAAVAGLCTVGRKS